MVRFFKWKALLAVMVAIMLTAMTACGPSAKSTSGTAANGPANVSLFTQSFSYIGNLNSNWFTKYAEKTFNMKINWTTVPSTDVTTKQSVLLGGGDYPDIIWDGSLTNAQSLKYGQQGVFVPLNDLIKKYAPNVWRTIQTEPELKQSVFAPDGKIYALPSYNYCLHCDFSAKYWVYKPLLQKYNLTLPKTTTQFEHMLEVFKQHGIIPLTGATDGWNSDPTTFLMNSFIYDDSTDYMYINQGKPAFAPAQDQWKQGLQYIHSLFSKGLVSSTALTQTNDVLTKQAINHQVGVVPWGCINCVLGTNHLNDMTNWETIPPLTGPQGTHYAAFFGNGLNTDVFAVTNKANLQEEIAVMKLLNFIWTPKGLTMFNYGPKGKYWTDAKPGEKGIMGTQSQYDLNTTNLPNPENSGWDQMGPMGQTAAMRNSYTSSSPFAKDGSGSEAFLQYYTEKDYIGNQPKQVVPSTVWVKPAEAQQYALLQTNIDNYVKQWTAEFIVGSKSINKDWGTYVTGLKKLGLDQYLSMTNSAMGKPFNTSSFKQDPEDIKFLETEK